jgi:hypothetical protein
MLTLYFYSSVMKTGKLGTEFLYIQCDLLREVCEHSAILLLDFCLTLTLAIILLEGNIEFIKSPL